MEELYGLPSCTFNVHQLIHLADGVKSCGPLWSTSAFAFEANNHMLSKMFSGTSFIPQQICNTSILANKLPSLARECFPDGTSAAARPMFNKLVGEYLPGKNTEILQDNLVALGHGESVTLSAIQAVAIMTFLELPHISNRRATVYNRFISRKVLYTAQSCTTSNKHHDFTVTVDHPVVKYGTILGLYNVKPNCQCSTIQLQHCQCEVHQVVLINVMECRHTPLFSDRDFNVQSDFIDEVYNIDSIIAMLPESIGGKCICIEMTKNLSVKCHANFMETNY